MNTLKLEHIKPNQISNKISLKLVDSTPCMSLLLGSNSHLYIYVCRNNQSLCLEIKGNFQNGFILNGSFKIAAVSKGNISIYWIIRATLNEKHEALTGFDEYYPVKVSDSTIHYSDVNFIHQKGIFRLKYYIYLRILFFNLEK